MRTAWIISAIAAMGLATSASAQQVDQNTRQQIEKINAAFEEAYNKQDAAGIAGAFAKDRVLIVVIGKHVYTGQQEIEQFYQGSFKAGFNHNEGVLKELTPFGADMVIAIGEYHVSGQGQNGPLKVDGHCSAVDVREGGVWKIAHAASLFLLAAAHRQCPLSDHQPDGTCRRAGARRYREGEARQARRRARADFDLE
jgi:uncharacterized protein (TIGR02246 family)